MKFHTTRESALKELNGLTSSSYYDFSPRRSAPLMGVWSKSALSRASHSPHEWRAGINQFATGKMIFGNIVDTLMTEPELFDSRYFITEHTDGRRKPYQDDKKKAEEMGLQIVKKSEIKQAEDMIESITQHPLGRVVLQPGTETQKPLTAVFEITGPDGTAFVAFKGLPDFFVNHGDGTCSIYDLKTTMADNDRELTSISRRFCYPWQELLYTKLAEANGFTVRDFAFVFVCTAPPYRTRYVEINAEALDGATTGLVKAFSMIYAMGNGKTPYDVEPPKLIFGQKVSERNYWDTLPELQVPCVQVV